MNQVLVSALLISLGCVGIWSLVTGLLAVMSGWWQLAIQYGSRQPSEGKRYSMVSGMVGSAAFLVNYNHSLTVFITNDGFYIQPLPVFGHVSRNLFIPWQNVQITKTSYWFFPVYRVQVTNSWVTFMFFRGFGSVIFEAWTASRSSLEMQRVS